MKVKIYGRVFNINNYRGEFMDRCLIMGVIIGISKTLETTEAFYEYDDVDSVPRIVEILEKCLPQGSKVEEMNETELLGEI